MESGQVDKGQTAATTEAHPAAMPPGELLIGTVAGLDPSGRPKVRVSLEGGEQTLVVTPAVAVTLEQVGRQGVVMCAGGDIGAPVLLGFVHSPLDLALSSPARDDADAASVDAHVDGEPTLIEGRERVVLRCGAASITLTREGKIILRGQHLVSRSEGVNRILGASVQMN